MENAVDFWFSCRCRTLCAAPRELFGPKTFSPSILDRGGFHTRGLPLRAGRQVRAGRDQPVSDGRRTGTALELRLAYHPVMARRKKIRIPIVTSASGARARNFVTPSRL